MDFEKFYEDYGRIWSNKKRQKYEILASKWKSDIFFKHFYYTKIKLDSILEYGCGPAYILKNFDKKLNNLKIVGIDISNSMLKLAKKNIPNGTFIKNDQISYKNKIDLVLLIDILEHIKNPNKVLKESKLISNYIFIKVPLEKCLLKNIFRFFRKIKINSEGHINFWNKRDVFNILEEVDIKIIKYKTLNPPKKLQFKKGTNKLNLLLLMYRMLGKIIFIYQPLYSFLFGTHLFILCKSK